VDSAALRASASTNLDRATSGAPASRSASDHLHGATIASTRRTNGERHIAASTAV
jgi:hypothetical protein